MKSNRAQVDVVLQHRAKPIPNSSSPPSEGFAQPTKKKPFSTTSPRPVPQYMNDAETPSR